MFADCLHDFSVVRGFGFCSINNFGHITWTIVAITADARRLRSVSIRLLVRSVFSFCWWIFKFFVANFFSSNTLNFKFMFPNSFYPFATLVSVWQCLLARDVNATARIKLMPIRHLNVNVVVWTFRRRQANYRRPTQSTIELNFSLVRCIFMNIVRMKNKTKNRKIVSTEYATISHVFNEFRASGK